MIKCYTGMPGGGKTFALTNEAYRAMKKGRVVYSNYYIVGAHKIEFEDLTQFAFPMNCVVILDEAGRWFNSRTWDKLPKDIFDLFTMHRHMKLDLILGVQNFARIDKSLREVIELTYWANNPWFLPFFIHDGYYNLEKVGHMGQSDVTRYVWKTGKIKRMYDTHGMKSAWDDKEELPLRIWESHEGFEPKKTLLDKVKYSVLQWTRKKKKEKEWEDEMDAIHSEKLIDFTKIGRKGVESDSADTELVLSEVQNGIEPVGSDKDSN